MFLKNLVVQGSQGDMLDLYKSNYLLLAADAPTTLVLWLPASTTPLAGIRMAGSKPFRVAYAMGGTDWPEFYHVRPEAE